MYGVEVGTISCGFMASTTAGWPRLTSGKDPGFRLTSQIWANRCGGNGMMMDSYPHPQHMKVVNHLSYVWSGSGNHFMWVYGPAIAVGWPQLAPDKDPGFWLTSQIWWANRCGGNGMMMDPYPHPQHMKVVNHL